MTYTEVRPARWTLNEVDDTCPPWFEAAVIPAAHLSPSAFSEAAERPRPAAVGTWLGVALARLDRLAALRPGWDGEKARAVSPEVLDAVRSFVGSDVIERTPAKPEIVPTFDGGLQLEWHTDTVDLIIECEPSAGVTYYFRDVENEKEHEGSALDPDTPLGEAFVKLGFKG